MDTTENARIWRIINKHFEDNPQSLVRHHTDSYNDFVKNGIFQIFKEKNPITLNTVFDEKIDDYRCQCRLYMGGKDGTRIYFGKPVIYDDRDNTHYMFPNEARLRNMTYGMTVHYDVEVEITTILMDGESPNLVGADDIEEDDDDDQNKTKQKDNESKGGKAGGEGEDEDDEDDLLKGGGKDKDKQKEQDKQRERRTRRINKKRAKFATPAEAAFIREATAKSMVAPDKQQHSFIIDKIFLCKLPIMVQSHVCVLTGFPREVRHTMGECLNDVGGYFIIDGKEKTVVSQEKFADNMLYIKKMDPESTPYLYSADIRSVSENVSKPVRTFSVKIMAYKNKYADFNYGNIVVSIPNVRKPVPLFIVFRALGFISDKEIISMCLLDIEKYDDMLNLFAPSVYDAGGINTQINALKYIATFTKGKTVSHAYEILADYFLPHIGEMNFTQKAYYLGYIVFRLLNVYRGVEPITDRDNFKYKRIELVGSLLSDLFREYYSLQLRAIHLSFEEVVTYNKAEYETNLDNLINQHYQWAFNENRVVDSGIKKAFKGNWGATAHTKRIGVIQDLNRLSFNSMLSHLRKTNLPLDASVKLIGPRVLHSTQWGFFDPIDTPDGGNIGIHKHLSITTYITQGMSREPMIRWIREKLNMRLLEDCSPLYVSRMTKIFVNGLFAGVIENPDLDDNNKNKNNQITTHPAVEKMRLYRRNALIPIYTSISYSVKANIIYVYTDAGRLCRPIFYMDTDTKKMSIENRLFAEKLETDDFTWDELTTGLVPKKKSRQNEYKIYELNELYDTQAKTTMTLDNLYNESKAIIDYIDSSETEDAMIAIKPEDITKHTTHVEIHESLLLGIMCNQISFPENNPASRNSFSCGQSKQACSLYHTNYQVRMDKTAVVLNSGQIPIVKSRFSEHINKEENTYGENTIVAIMSYTGYNVEDGILVNEGALMRGLFRTTYFSVYETHEEKSKSGETVFANIDDTANVVGTKPGYDYSKLDAYGMIRENTEINDKTVLIGLVSKPSMEQGGSTDPAMLGKIMDVSKTPKKGQIGVVDKSFITEGSEGMRIAKVRVREVRVPNIGDKMASRNGQKGVVGLVIPEINMPFTKDGVRPDIIINPHAIPSRMTIGQLVECIIGKAAVVQGAFADCTPFNNKGSKIKVFGEMLSHVGFHSSGNEILYNGMTGEQIESEIFFGPTYYMRLKHMVKDKINFRTTGPRTALTRQPVSGRANDGGLRIGEMERDSVISHGTANFLNESMMERGDKYYMAVCNTTGMVAIYNPSKNLFMSPMADGPLKFTEISTINSKDNNNSNNNTNTNDNSVGIEQITRFGRDFSVVCIPYSLKLLMQELQTINVQMRIITEDNIEQLENMSFSTNFNKLLMEKNTTMQVVVDKLKAEFTKDKKQIKPFINVTHTNPPNRPDYDDILAKKPFRAEEWRKKNNTWVNIKTGETRWQDPAINNDEQNDVEFKPNEVPEPKPKKAYWVKRFSQKYQRPFWYNVYTNESVWVDPTQPQEQQQQQSPEYAPVDEESLTDTFKVGDEVFYRGDRRLWKIVKIGVNFITITTEQGVNDKDKVVTKDDIYFKKDIDSDGQQQLVGGQMQMMGGGQIPGGGGQMQMPGQMMSQQMQMGQMGGMGGMGGIGIGQPPFVFSPQIKVIGGSDFSTPLINENMGGGGEQYPQFDSQQGGNMFNVPMIKRGGGDEPTGRGGERAEGGGDGNPDLSNSGGVLVVKKM